MAIELMVSNALSQVYSVSEGWGTGRCGYRAHGQHCSHPSVSEGVGHREVWL